MKPGAGVPVPAPLPDRPAAPSFEEHLGLTWLTRVGAGVFLLGALFFFKYAVDNAWIGPTGRVAIGAVVGLALLGAAEVIRARTRPFFVQALTGLGLATLFVSVWASAAFYQLLSAPMAFVVSTVILFLGAALALRHRGESILVLTLVAGFLNPVVLSTGQDRPLELFAYLLLVTSVAHAVALLCSFRLAPLLAVLGVAALFGGWYAKFFDARDRRDLVFTDVPAEALVGPYFALSARVVPLVFTGLFAAQWAALSLLHRARAAAAEAAEAGARRQRDLPVALALAALVLAHAGAALLLYDAPRLLAVIAIGLALASIALLRRLDTARLLVLPMAAAFVAFLAVSGGVPLPQRTVLTALLGVWTLVYLVGFLRGLAREGVIPASAAISAAVSAALFDGLAAVLLAEHKPALFVFLLGLSSAVVAFLAARSGLRALRLFALAGTLVALLLTAAISEHVLDGPADPVFLAATFAWALVHVGAVLEDSLRRRATVTWGAVITASLATLGFLATAMLATGPDTPTLCALLTAAAGVTDLAAGALLLRVAGRARDPAALLLAQALGIFAAAIAFALSGASITVLWAALAAVAAIFAARTGDRLWLGAAALLFLATLTRILAVDAPAAQEGVDRFFATGGREGALTVPVLFNARAYGLAGAGVALLVSAYALSRGERAPFRRPAAAAATVGHGLFLALAVLEVRSLVLRPPPAPEAPLDAAELMAFLQQYEDALAAQRGWAAMSVTLVMALFAALLLAAGFAARDAFHRYLGLALFSITVLKLALWDVWTIPRVYQILLLTGVGALLVGGGFLYARFGRRILTLMREGAGPAGPAVLLALALLGGSTRAGADEARPPPLPVAAFKVVRPVEGIDAPGDYAVEVDADLYRASEADALLGDVRVAGPDGVEVPYVVEDAAPLRGARRDEPFDAVMLDPSLGSEGAVYATFRVAPRRDHCRVELDLDGGTFLRKVKVETGEDPRALGLLVEGPYVYRVRDLGGEVEHRAVPYPRSSASLVRVTLLPEGASASVRIRGGRFSCPEGGEAALTRPFTAHPLAIVEATGDPSAKTTALTLDAGAEGLPVEALRLEVATPEFSRNVEVTATSYRAVWPGAGGGMIYRINGRDGPIELVRVPIRPTRKRWFKLVVHDEDSAPLAIRAVAGEVTRRTIVLRAARAGAHVLYAGDRMRAPPHYDLGEILARGELDAPRRPAILGAARPNPRFGVKERPENLPLTERYRTPIGVALAIVLIGLSIWAVGLLRKPAAP